MFTLFSGFWQYVTRKDEYYVLILGLDNAGKTTLLEQLKHFYNPKYKGIPLEKITTTVGLNVAKVDAKKACLIFWDLGGQIELHSLWDKYYSEAHGVMYVIDSTDPARFEASRSAFESMVQHPYLEGVPLLILANKQDVSTALTVQDIKDVFNASSRLVGQRDCKVQPVCAITGEGLASGMTWLLDGMIKNISRPPKLREV
eukprot:Opistho-2@2681